MRGDALISLAVGVTSVLYKTAPTPIWRDVRSVHLTALEQISPLSVRRDRKVTKIRSVLTALGK